MELLKNARGQVSRVTEISCTSNSGTGHSTENSSHKTRRVKWNPKGFWLLAGKTIISFVIVQLASVVSQFLSQGIYGCVVWLKGYPVVDYEDLGVIQLYKMCLLLVNSYCTLLLLHIQPFYDTLFLCFLEYACTTVHHTLVPLSAVPLVVLSCYNLLRPSSLKPFSDQVVDHHYPL